MGQSIAKVRKEMTNAEQKQEFAERLQVLEKMVEYKLHFKLGAILEGELNAQEIDGGTIVSLHKMVFIKTGDTESEDIKNVIHRLFSGDFVGGLESIVRMGAESVLDNESAGEYESSDMFIVWSDNALLRCDAYYYRWNFVSKSVIKEIQAVTGCLLMKRVIDITKTDPQVLTWAVTTTVDRLNKAKPTEEGDEDDVSIYII